MAAIDVDTDVDVVNEHIDSSNLHDNFNRKLEEQHHLDDEPSIAGIIGGSDADVNEYPWFARESIIVQ